ncbi:unnamed protein product [Schistocephalus solidus]|uniref:GMC_OxRdtase_N domain-containing protein n=1 Tax=Schistocephalus solidus TaxID=70667 RepID=A0A183TTL3_SCHSO|nr:unnamed protein product [Schistocephalus solidus]
MPLELSSGAVPLIQGAIYGLDEAEKVLRFIAPRVPLDNLDIAGPADILHLPQPLLHKAAASEEGRFVGVDPVVHVGPAQSVILGGKFTDICVGVVKPNEL